MSNEWRGRPTTRPTVSSSAKWACREVGRESEVDERGDEEPDLTGRTVVGEVAGR